jgi:uncharacterized LabA/DUF88 family protein
VLVDGEFFSRALRTFLRLPHRPTAEQVYRNAVGLLDSPAEEVWRIFYYDSRPFAGHETHPVTRELIDYSRTPIAQARERFLNELGQKDLIALRCGQTKPRGWQFKSSYLQRLTQPPIVPPGAGDYELRFEQKGVDMRIGIDVATLSLNRYVERIIVASNDTDIIPAFKLARRHGVQVVIAQIGSFNPHRDLVEDADFKRRYAPVA